MADSRSTEHVRTALSACADAVARLKADAAAIESIAAAGDLFTETLRRNGRVFACGNGGSMCDAMHFAEELSGRFRKDRRPLAAVAISDPGHLTCTANDLGFEEVFSRYLEGHGRSGDSLLAISTSGRSPNILAAARRARAIGMTVVALTGRPESALAGAADVEICTPAGEWSDRIQELHIKVIHILVELIERRLFPENYA